MRMAKLFQMNSASTAAPARNKAAIILGLMFFAASISPAVLAETFPIKPISLIVPYAPGGASDILARTMARYMSNELGQPVIVENVSGATGSIGAKRVLSKPADGYQIFVGSPNELILGPLSTASPSFKSEDFEMIGNIGDFTLALISRGNFPPNNMPELIDYASTQEREGNSLTYGSVGQGSLYHLLGEKFSQQAGVSMLHVPYKGGSPMAQDLLAGRIDLYFGVLGPTVTPPLTNGSGSLKMFGIISPQKSATFESTPLIRNTPNLEDFSYSLWLGLFLKRGTPSGVIETLHNAANRTLAIPEAKKIAEMQQFNFAEPQTLEQVDGLYASSIDKYRSIFESIGLKP